MRLVNLHPQTNFPWIKVSLMYFLLFYDYVEDILERRDPFRPGHLAQVESLISEDKMAMAGALTDPVDGAVFVFKTEDINDIENFVKNDPYFQNNLVTGYRIRPWTVVGGSLL